MTSDKLFGSISASRHCEWHDVRYLQPVHAKRSATISLFLVLWIAVADLCLPDNLAILYVAPLVLLACFGSARPLWRTTCVLVLLTYGVYFLKNTINPSDPNDSYFNFRFFNRSLVAMALVAMGEVLQLWMNWRADQNDAELADDLRYEEQQTNSLFAIVCCAGLTGAIALVDFLLPANLNLAILYPIPLFICGWTRSRPLLWTTLGVILILTAAAFWLGPPPTVLRPGFARNRLLVAIGLICVTATLNYWMRREDAVVE